MSYYVRTVVAFFLRRRCTSDIVS